jgi:hypothetical protein
MSIADILERTYIDSSDNQQIYDAPGWSNLNVESLNSQNITINGAPILSTSDIAQLSSDIALIDDVVSDVARNTSDIQSNLFKIEDNKVDIDTNELILNNALSDIYSLQSDTTANTLQIATNSSNIATNSLGIAINTNSIGSLTSDTAINTSDINSLGTFASDIALVVKVDELAVETRLNIYNGELSVGRPDQGFETTLGGGDSYVSFTDSSDITYNTFVLTHPDATNLSTTSDALYIDNTPNSFSDTAFEPFVSDVINNTTLIGSPFEFYGVKVNVKNAFVDGDIYPNTGDSKAVKYQKYITNSLGSDVWVNVPYMTTNAGGLYESYANSLFNVSDTSFQCRFRNTSNANTWNKKDFNGVNAYWCRMILTSDTSSKPTCGQIKFHTSRIEFNNDGFIEYFGNCRCVSYLPGHLGWLQAATNSPGNQDLFLSKGCIAGFIENSFQNGALGRVGYAFNVPLDIDSSYFYRAQFAYMGESSTAGNALFKLFYGQSVIGQEIYLSSTAAPSDIPTQGVLEQLITIDGANENKQGLITFDIDIEEFNINPKNEIGGVAWITIERTGNSSSDTYNGDINLLSIRNTYVKHREGGRILNFNN